jgi:hypothetical protein
MKLNFPILINGRTSDNKANPNYWTNDILSIIERQTGWDYQERNNLRSDGTTQFSGDFMFVNGDVATFPNDRRIAGIAQGVTDAPMVLEQLINNGQTNSRGEIVEKLQVITHSRGSAFGVGYMVGLVAEVWRLAQLRKIYFAYPMTDMVEYSANFAPHQSGWIDYPLSGSKNVNTAHVGDPLSGPSATGDVINVDSLPEEEQGPLEQHYIVNFQEEMEFILHILENNTDKTQLFNEVSRAYQFYDEGEGRKNQFSRSTVTRGGE